MIETDEFPQDINLVLLLSYLVPLLLDLHLLFFEGVDENDAEAIVLDAFDLAFRVVIDEQRVDGRDLRSTRDSRTAAPFNQFQLFMLVTASGE